MSHETSDSSLPTLTPKQVHEAVYLYLSGMIMGGNWGNQSLIPSRAIYASEPWLNLSLGPDWTPPPPSYAHELAYAIRQVAGASQETLKDWHPRSGTTTQSLWVGPSLEYGKAYDAMLQYLRVCVELCFDSDDAPAWNCTLGKARPWEDATESERTLWHQSIAQVLSNDRLGLTCTEREVGVGIHEPGWKHRPLPGSIEHLAAVGRFVLQRHRAQGGPQSHAPTGGRLWRVVWPATMPPWYEGWFHLKSGLVEWSGCPDDDGHFKMSYGASSASPTEWWVYTLDPIECPLSAIEVTASGPLVVSTEVRAAIESAGLTGATFGAMQIDQKEHQYIPPETERFVLIPTGSCGQQEIVSGWSPISDPCPTCGWRRWSKSTREVVLTHLDQWDGSDFATVDGIPGALFCSDRARLVLESCGPTNIAFKAAKEFLS